MQGIELGMSGRGARKLEKPKVSLQGFFPGRSRCWDWVCIGVDLGLWEWACLFKAGHSTQSAWKKYLLTANTIHSQYWWPGQSLQGKTGMRVAGSKTSCCHDLPMDLSLAFPHYNFQSMLETKIPLTTREGKSADSCRAGCHREGWQALFNYPTSSSVEANRFLYLV